MVTHELTVFPDGRVDGAVCVREGDYKSHTLHFVFAERLARGEREADGLGGGRGKADCLRHSEG